MDGFRLSEPFFIPNLWRMYAEKIRISKETGHRRSQVLLGTGHRPVALCPDEGCEKEMTRSQLAQPHWPKGSRTNTGAGVSLVPVDIGHEDYTCLIDPDTAFWALVEKGRLAETLIDSTLMHQYRKKASSFRAEIDTLRFGNRPSCVYVNITERCNLNCTYCYIPEDMRRGGRSMSRQRLMDALTIIADSLQQKLPSSVTPQIIFHGAEPMMNRDVLFAAIEQFGNRFLFGVQTNATLLDQEAISFLTQHGVSIGLSLDAPTAAVSDRTRKTWNGTGVSQHVRRAMKQLQGYGNWSVISTITGKNLTSLSRLVELFHAEGVPTCMLNAVRCTLPGAREIKPSDTAAARAYLKALDRSRELYEQTGRKLVVANFANILLAIIAPSARRLMCDISPCGGGRCFFALAPNGDAFPCSEFIGLKEFRGGNIFKMSIDGIMKSKPFRQVTERSIEAIEPCKRCAIRHFCGSPCPAEAHQMHGAMNSPGAFCGFYEEQVRYAFRTIANNRIDAYLWDGWDDGLKVSFSTL